MALLRLTRLTWLTRLTLPPPPDSLAGRAAAALLHALIWTVLATTLYGLGLLHVLPGTDSILATPSGGLPWDAGWFWSIITGGYSYTSEGQSNVAFFPLFPVVWRWLGVGWASMGLLNAAVFLAAFTGLAHTLRLSRRWMLLTLSVPSTLFMVIPYSEAWFFLFSALLLGGLHRGQTGWVLLGLFGCGLTRSASTLFTPALLFTVGNLLLVGQWRRALVWGVGGGLALAASLAVVLAYQTSFPGVPAGGFAAAHEFWGHKIDWPLWPLFSEAGPAVLWYSAVGLALAAAATAGGAWLVGRGVAQVAGRQSAPAVSPAVLFALGYCAAATLFVLTFQQGEVAGLHRYLFGSAFFVVLVWQMSRWPAWPLRTYAALVAGLLAFWHVFGAWGRLPNFSLAESGWYFGLTTAYAVTWLGVRQWRYAREIGTALYCFNLLYQLFLLDMAYQANWIE